MKAKYECWNCKLVFEDKPGPVKYGCPQCGSIWYTWLNYHELFPVKKKK